MGCCHSKGSDSESRKNSASTVSSDIISSDYTSLVVPEEILVALPVAASTSWQENPIPKGSHQRRTSQELRKPLDPVKVEPVKPKMVNREAEGQLPQNNSLLNDSHVSSMFINLQSKVLTRSNADYPKVIENTDRVTPSFCCNTQREAEKNEPGTPKTLEKYSPADAISLAVNDKISQSSPSQPSPFDEFESLAPICELSEKEVVSIKTDICGIKKENDCLDNLIYVIIAHKFYKALHVPLNLENISLLLKEITEEMKSVIYAISTEPLPVKLTFFVKVFDCVFEIKGLCIARLASGESWLQKAVIDRLKYVLVDLIEKGKTGLFDLVEFFVCALGCSAVPEIGEMTEANLANFLSQYKSIFGIAGQKVFLIPTLGQSFGPNVDQNCLKDMVNFFKKELQACAIPYTELPLMLSMKNPELLAVLVDRTCAGILALLLRDKAFKCVDGLVMLQGFIPVPQNLTPSESKVRAKPEANQNCCCCSSGIVLCVGKSRATLWCSYSDHCKNVFIVAKRKETFVNIVLGDAFTDVLREGDQVIFTTTSVSKEGWSMDYAACIKVVKGDRTCLCKKRQKMDVFFQQHGQANGIPFGENCMFFWNCRGTLECLNGMKGTVKCRFSSSSDQYFYVYLTDKTWYAGLHCKSEEANEYFSVGDTVEVDVALHNLQNGLLRWRACCLRKLPFTKGHVPVAWNCAATVTSKTPLEVVLTIEEDAIDGPLKGTTVSCPPNSTLLFEDGFVTTNYSPDVLKMNDRLVLDAEEVKKGSWTAKFIRLHKRPKVANSLDDSLVMVSALRDLMMQDFPALPSGALETLGSSQTLKELEEIIGQRQSLGPGTLQTRFSSDLISEKLSWSSESYALGSPLNNHVKPVKNSTCQTVSTGPVLSTWFPT